MKYNKRVLAVIATVVLLVSALAGGLLLAEEPLAVFAAQGAGDGDDEDTPLTGETLERASDAALQHARDNGMGQGEVTETEAGDDEGAYEVEVTLEDGSEVEFTLNEAFEVIGQENEDEEGETSEDEDDENEAAEDEAAEDEAEDQPITGAALEQASAAALQYMSDNGRGQGEVTDTEVGDEEGYYEIEVTLENGEQVDVHLNEAFEVVGQEEEASGDDD